MRRLHARAAPKCGAMRRRIRVGFEVGIGVGIVVGLVVFVVWALRAWQSGPDGAAEMIRMPDTPASRQLR